MTSYSTFGASPVTAALGAEIDGIDLNAPLTEVMQTELRDALSEHLVLFFRDQCINDEAHLALASCFGEPEVHPIRGALGDPSRLHDIIDTTKSEPDRDGWHTDVTYMERPPCAAVLRCEETPSAGGDTLWANMQLAYDKLSDGMKTYLANLQGFHATDGRFIDYIQRHLPEDAVEKIMKAASIGRRARWLFGTSAQHSTLARRTTAAARASCDAAPSLASDRASGRRLAPHVTGPLIRRIPGIGLRSPVACAQTFVQPPDRVAGGMREESRHEGVRRCGNRNPERLT